MKYVTHLYVSAFFALILFSASVYAQEHHAKTDSDIKTSFISAWEKHQRSLPTTVTLEKTDKPNIYNYETTLFPYKGKLILNNVVISKDLNYYYDYDLILTDVVKGAAEIELAELTSDEFYEKYPHSRPLWEKENFLLYDEISNKWLSPKEWENKTSDIGEYDVSNTKKSSHSCYKETVLALFSGLWPFILFVIIFLVIVWRGKKFQDAQSKKIDLSLERQLESLELQKQAFEVQKRATKILEQSVNNKDRT